MGLILIFFADHHGGTHKFRHAFFDKSDGDLPSRKQGVYILLARNKITFKSWATHVVLYVGITKNRGLRERMFSHTQNEYYKRYNAIRKWPHDVLFILDSDPGVISRPEICLVDRRKGYERELHGLFVPLCAWEYPDEKRRGREQGHVAFVNLDLRAGTMEWARSNAVRVVCLS